jgi:hypothetical protein
MISGGSWAFNKKEKGNNNVYARFRLKSKIPTEDRINQVSFKFSCVGEKDIFKKQHQAMETKTPLMLLFVCNGTNQGSILSDTRQMLDLAYDDIKQDGMMPEEFKNKDIPHFSLCLNVPCLLTQSRTLTGVTTTTRSKAKRRITLKSPRKRYRISRPIWTCPLSQTG